MGNHHGGFMHRRPEFIGKSLSYVTEKRRKSTAAMRRPNSTANFSDSTSQTHRDANDAASITNSTIAEENDQYPRSKRSTSEPKNDSDDGGEQTGGGKPSRGKRKNSLKSSKGATLRCSPTVPDALTFTLDVATAGIGVGMAAVGDVEAVESALRAIQKLTPAAPRLFSEPVFDEFFEEAERRNLTMEVLQAAFAAPSPSLSEDDAAETKASYSGDKGRSPARSSLASISNGKSKETLNIIYATSGGCEDERAAEGGGGGFNGCSFAGTSTGAQGRLLRSQSKGRLVVIVGGGAVDGDSADGEHRPPALIVQPAIKPLLSSNSTASLTSSSCSMMSNGGSILGKPSGSEARRGSIINHSASTPTVPPTTATHGVVRFADHDHAIPPAWFSESGDSATASTRCSSNQLHTEPPSPAAVSSPAATAAARAKRVSLRRKTIGCAMMAAATFEMPVGSTPDITSSEPTSPAGSGSSVHSTTTAAGRIAHQRSEDQHHAHGHHQQRLLSVTTTNLRKKSLSKSDLLCPPPIITLLKPPQIILIRQLWQQIYNTKGPTVLGNHIFQRVFFKNPQIKDVFRQVDVGNHHINVDAMCKTHAKAVAACLDDVVRSLENLREVEPKLTEIGRKHAVFYDLGFHINFWSVFAEAFIDCTLEWGEKNRRVEEARKAWAIIIAYITDKMKLGFQEARRNNMPRAGRRPRHSDSTEGEGRAVP